MGEGPPGENDYIDVALEAHRFAKGAPKEEVKPKKTHMSSINSNTPPEEAKAAVKKIINAVEKA
ncbi:hypothetical protein ACFL1M_00920 [Patescibacteria group bacterium]